MKQESSEYLKNNAQLNKSNGTIEVRVIAPVYKNRNTDTLVWISTQDVISWLAESGHKIKAVVQEGRVRNKYSDQDVTWVFSTKNKSLKKSNNSVKVKRLDNTKKS